jgi:hypothetical protein
VSTTAAIDAFWQWWATANQAFAQAFSTHGPLDQALLSEMSQRVEAIDPALDWEFGPGSASEHHLCLSAKGDPVLRVLAERWVKRGPPPDKTWEYYASRQASPARALTLEIAGAALALDDLAFDVDEDDSRERLHLRGHHPVFAKVDDESLRLRILFIGLDNLLGEDGVERWIGGVDAAVEPLAAPVPYKDLLARVERLAQRATGSRWAILKGEHDGMPIFVSTNRALKRVDHLLLDMHVTIDVPLLAPTPEGLTTRDEADTLNRIEDELCAALGEHAALIGRETGRGRRTIHLHVAEGGPARAVIDRWAARHPDRPVEVQTRMDPRWEVLDRWG